MSPDQFVQRKYESWQQLERLIEQARRHATGLNESEVRALGKLYRAATADLALAQRDFPQHAATRYLNTLVGRAHHLVYRGARPEQGRIRDFFTTDFPRLYRYHLRHIALAALLLFGPWILAQAVVTSDPETAYTIAPGASGTLDVVKYQERLWIDLPPEERPNAGAMIMTNNIQVALMAFAGGMTAGLLTLYVLLANGLTFGAVFGFVEAHGLSAGLWNFVTAHAPIELTVICMAGGAGLRIAHAMVMPGLYTRRMAVEQAVPPALRLLLGGALLLVVAGLIEGFISPSDIPYRLKLLVAIVTGVLLHGYLLLAGRKKADEA